MLKVTLREIEEFGIELNHTVGITPEEHEELMDEADYYILSSRNGIMALLHNDGRGHLMPSTVSDLPGGLLTKKNPNFERLRRLYLAKGAETRLGREKLPTDEFKIRVEYLCNLIEALNNAGRNELAAEVSEDVKDLVAGQGVLKMGIGMVKTDGLLN